MTFIFDLELDLYFAGTLRLKFYTTGVSTVVTNFDYVFISLIFRVCHTTESKSDFGLLLAANR